MQKVFHPYLKGRQHLSASETGPIRPYNVKKSTRLSSSLMLLLRQSVKRFPQGTLLLLLLETLRETRYEKPCWITQRKLQMGKTSFITDENCLQTHASKPLNRSAEVCNVIKENDSTYRLN